MYASYLDGLESLVHLNNFVIGHVLMDMVDALAEEPDSQERERLALEVNQKLETLMIDLTEFKMNWDKPPTMTTNN